MTITRLHISSFIGLIIAVWLLALWMQGMPVLSVDYIKPFSIVVGVITVIATVFNKYAWSWKIFRGWYVSRPDLRGTWKVELNSNWIDPKTSKPLPPIIGYAVVRQSLTFLSFRLMTEESHSSLIAHSLEKEEDGVFKFTAIFRNEPKLELHGERSDIHYGSFSLEVYDNPVSSMEGYYWTARGTKGSMTLGNRKNRLFNTYEQACNSL